MDLQQGLKKLALPATSAQEALLTQYVELLLRWNRVYNLISKETEAQILTLHILDSLSVSPYLHGSRIIDVGTGAGLPGIPLAIMNPERSFTLLDSNGKRTRFLKQCQIDLALSNVHIIQERAESFLPDILFDSVVTRAFAEVNDAARATKHLLQPNGRLLAMHGLAPEKNALPMTMHCERVIPLHVPGLAAERHLVELVKKE